jgi:environmental stress-induced protein Ves
MSLNAKITAAVNKAFAAVGDLVVLATLSSKSVSDYDFSARGLVASTTTQTVEVVIQSTQKPSGDGFTTTALLKSGPDLSVYDTLTVGSDVYNIVDSKDDTFIITLIIVREK